MGRSERGGRRVTEGGHATLGWVRDEDIFSHFILFRFDSSFKVFRSFRRLDFVARAMVDPDLEHGAMDCSYFLLLHPLLKSTGLFASN